MIFVTVGTTYFDELVEQVDRLVREGEIEDDVLAQIGSGTYVPSSCRWVRYLDSLEPEFLRADLVICAGGATVFELLRLRKNFIAVPNRSVRTTINWTCFGPWRPRGPVHAAGTFATSGPASRPVQA